MQLESFKQQLKNTLPPPHISVYLLAMWQDGKDNWEEAHQLINDLEDANACWVHAYLHRKEGDTFNADYWYRKANKQRPNIQLAEEWDNIVKALL
ncbi:MAG: hypothetical protein ABIN94_19860 [Ferruginibacter sp.]